MPEYDVVTFGETMLRLNPPGFQRLEQAAMLEIQVGGSESNTAVALMRLGRKVSWWSRLPPNPIGRRIESEIRGNGVDTSGVIWEDGRAGVYFLEFGVAPRAHEITYDRSDSAASHITPDDIDFELMRSARHLHLTGITAALSADCAATCLKAAQDARQTGLTVSLDLNFRRKLWTADSARRVVESMLPYVNLLITPALDAVEVFGTEAEAESAAVELRERYGLQNVVVTAGVEGAVAATESGIISATSVESGEVDRVGGGDAFGAGVIDGFLAGDLERGLRFGCAMAALKRTIPGDMLLVSREEIESVVSSAPMTIRR